MSAKRKYVLILSVLLYAVVFHVVYNSFWSVPARKTSGQNSWGIMKFWNHKIYKNDEEYGDENVLDVHIEDPKLGHTGETLSEKEGKSHSHPFFHQATGSNSVAIGGGITSKGLSGVNVTNIESKFQLFFTFLPTFCETASPGFDYHFYFSYDSTDSLFQDMRFLGAFQRTFLSVSSSLCSGSVKVSIHMVQCSHSGKPTWAQNDAMLEAYLDNIEYYYRINDDTRLITKNWTERFIAVLRNYNPSNVGVVGPNHSGGNTAILTYDFVHRTHLDIFGFYYPRLFTDWWGDRWITNLYKPNRMTKVKNVLLDHTLGRGQRYGVNWAVREKLKMQLLKDISTLNRFIKYRQKKESVKVDRKKVIAMSLYSRDQKYTWGAIRNAQIAPIFFPGWKLRVYVSSRSSKAPNIKSWLVPKRILNKLRQLGAEIAYVKTKSIPPIFWRYLVVDDRTIDYFIIRNADSRLSERDAITVNDWLAQQSPDQTRNVWHCIRDHPNHANLSIVDGLWGGNREVVRRLLGQDMVNLLETFHSSNANRSSTDWYADLIYRLANSHRHSSGENDSFSVLRDILWPLMSSVAYCHDSVSCDKWPNAHAFSVERKAKEYLGQKFDQHHEPISNKNDELLTNDPSLCTNIKRVLTTTVAMTTVGITTTIGTLTSSKNR